MNFKTIIFAFVIILSTLISTKAIAASHDIDGCIYLYDSREVSPTHNYYIGVEDLEIEVYFTKSNGTTLYAGNLTTNSSGCFAGELKGSTVPDNTTITTNVALRNTTHEVLSDDNDVYYYRVGQITTSSDGEAVDYGELLITDADYYSYYQLTMWMSAIDSVDLYENRVGASWPGSSYNTLKIKYPSSDDISNTLKSRIAITEEAKDDFITFLHEFGHFIGQNDAAKKISAGGYTASYYGSSYPYDLPPYIYDASGTVSEYTHDEDTYEYDGVAQFEGHADFIADYLLDERCGNIHGDSNYSLNFDGQNNEQNIAGAYCDLVDSDNDDTAWRHIYDVSGHINRLGDTGYMAHPAMDTQYMYNSDGLTLTSTEFSTGTETILYDFTADAVDGLGYITPDANYFQIQVYDEYLCFTTINFLFCGNTDGDKTLEWVASPRTGDIHDIFMADNKLYTLIKDGSTWYVDSATIPAPEDSWTWSTVYTETVASSEDDFTAIATNSAASIMFLSRENATEYCSISSGICSGLNSHIGTNTIKGYKREINMSTVPANLKASYLYQVEDLVVVDDDLYIIDNYGVAYVEGLFSHNLEQFIGAGADPIFKNNLSRRSMYVDGVSKTLFATNGTKSYVYMTIFDFDDKRDTISTPELFLFDESGTVSDTTYCGTDNQTYSLYDVIHLYKNSDFGVDFQTAMKKINGMTTAIQNAISNKNWIVLNSNECTDWEGGSEIVKDDVLTHSSTSHPSTGGNEHHGYVSNDEDISNIPLTFTPINDIDDGGDHPPLQPNFEKEQPDRVVLQQQ